MKIWTIDENRRVYKDDDGNKTDRPNIRHAFVEWEVIHETRQSYIVNEYGREKRIAKENAFLTQEQIEDYIFVDRNRWKIADCVRDCRNANQLRRIAVILAEPRASAGKE